MARRRGFTLTELLVVIAILAILLGTSASVLLPLQNRLATIDTPGYRAAKMVEKAFKDARILAAQTGVPHSVAFNRPDATANIFQSNYAEDRDINKPPEGFNFFLILRHQQKEISGGNWTGNWVGETKSPWAEWVSWVDNSPARTMTGVRDHATNELLNNFAVNNVDSGMLPAGTGFHAFAAGIPAPSAGNTYRIWYWCWDDRNAHTAATGGAMCQNGGAMTGTHESVRVWIDAADRQDAARRGTSVPATPTAVTDLPFYSTSNFDGTASHPFALAARVTFAANGEMTAYAGGRPAVLPAGAYTPPYNFTLTPNGYHIVAVSSTTIHNGDIPSQGAGSRNLKTLANNNRTDSGNGSAFWEDTVYTYFVGIHQLTGDTFVKNRIEMLEWANEHFPCRVVGNRAVDRDFLTTGDNNGRRNQCLSGSDSCAHTTDYLSGVRTFVGSAAANTITTRDSVGSSGINCCQDEGCQWRAAVRLE